MEIKSINPANGQILKTFPTLTQPQALDVVSTADRAYRNWKCVSFAERGRVLSTFASLLRKQQEELARLITLEMGKRIAESRYEIEYCAKIADYYAEHGERFLADVPLEVEATAYLHYEPLGVLLGIMPWNFPFYQVIRFAAPNLMAGNTLLIKHASSVPQCAVAIEQLLSECNLPAGVYNNLLMSAANIEAVLANKYVQGVSLTGSERAGRSVAELAGKHLKKSVLELGGNDPFIVLEDAALDKTIELAVKGRIVNAGQSCVAAKRFIVVEQIAKPFIEGFKQAMNQLKIGDPLDETTSLAPLSSEQAAIKLHEQVRAAVGAGARIVLGGDRPNRSGAYFNATILTDISTDNPVFDEELFGPVASVYVVRDEQAAIALANQSSFGLGGSVYTRDVERGRRVAEQVESGMMYVNQPTKSQAELPFGGIKHSGYGREMSHLGILEFVNKKLMHLGCKL